MRKQLFRGMLFGLPLNVAIWMGILFHVIPARSHLGYVISNVWFAGYTVVVLVGYFWPQKAKS